MIKKFLSTLILTLAVMLVCGCFGDENVVTADMRGGKVNASGDQSSDSEVKGGQTVRAEVPRPDPIEEQLKSMTLKEKIGQMVFIGFYGTTINDDIRYSLNNFHFGGVILFDRNMESVAQVKKLTDDIKAEARQKAPLFIALDEEGGRVARGKNFLTPAPAQEDIGLDGDVSAATYWAEYNVDLLRSIGVNVNFAPVADVGSNDTRSFSYDGQLVADFVDASARGYEGKNFFYTLKHFPGIGKSKVDSHKEVSDITVSREVLEAEDFLPFERIIRNHDNSRFMIMVGHLRYTAIDPANSASLSSAIITELLRNEMGFKGVVITDDLEMGAIKNNVELGTLGVKVIKAGADIALVCHNYESQQIVYNSILDAVKRGEISEARIDESVRRILKMKAHLQ